jgi:serine/threonine-protein phosphatase 2A regulatory subunit B
VLTGSYHNFFRIFDTDSPNDVVLQADKSAFKAKKIGVPAGKNGLKNGPRPGGLRDAMQTDTLDFNKKILHASWHPRENTIAVSLLPYVEICLAFRCRYFDLCFMSVLCFVN